jgi:hypothetical protein
MPNAWIQSTVQYIRYGFRVFRRRPAVLVGGILVLALTVGATAAVQTGYSSGRSRLLALIVWCRSFVPEWPAVRHRNLFLRRSS